ncbi:MAG: hypothetical protein COT84_02960 [Chlamydiae bacterium CG10_big_fil_rev_8_21_14_0_10_35_9]|nr:MAG: hypothetical protein COT84_02960 [Chlamydiae bacterium CG10_big_fil_rev_8_21_14_0_10_35_9]
MNKELVEKEGLKGVLFYPDQIKKPTAIIVLPGSDGGVAEALSEYIASHSYIVLGLGYFGEEGLPSYLENIPLEYFQKAINWLRSRFDPYSLNLLGYSRGGELALILGSLFPDIIDGIVAFVPCSAACGGFPYPNKPAWTFNNAPISPYLQGVMSSYQDLSEAEDLFLASKEGIIPYHSNSEEDPYDIVDLFMIRHKNNILEKAAIPVENISCPILIIAGEQDKIWPSGLYGKLIIDRLHQKKSTIQKELLIYPNAGHGIIAPYEGPVYHPVGKFWCRLGGTPEGNQEANKKAWKATLDFFK